MKRAPETDPAELPAAVGELLGRSGRGFLLTLRPDGSPTAHPMTALRVGGRLAYNTYRRSAKARNLLRDPRSCSLVMADWSGEDARAIVYKGAAREADPAESGTPPSGTPASLPVSESVARRAQARLASGKRVMFLIEPGEVALLGAGPEPGPGGA